LSSRPASETGASIWRSHQCAASNAVGQGRDTTASVQVMAFDLDLSVVMNRNDPHFDDRLPVLVRFLRVDPVHEMTGAIRPAVTIRWHCSTPERSGLHCGKRSCRHRLVSAASSPEPPTSVGLACRPVGALRRHLMKQGQSSGENRLLGLMVTGQIGVDAEQLRDTGFAWAMPDGCSAGMSTAGSPTSVLGSAPLPQTRRCSGTRWSRSR
jgi:hypothetical protein